MKRLLVALVVLVVLGVGALPADAGQRAHVVRGQGTAQPGGRSVPYEFEFEARGTPARASGRFRYTSLLSLTGDVKCLAVKGNRAAISGKLRRPTPTGQYFLLVVEDNGPAQDPPVDTIFLEATEDLVRCDRALDRTGSLLQDGDIRVR